MITNVYLSSSTTATNNKIVIDPANNRENIIESISSALNLQPTEFYLTQNGKILSDNDAPISDTPNVYVHIKLVGGKGGFGSMLRAIGAQIEKTTNREACRDLSGRRLRDINEEKRLKAWLDKQGERDDEAAAKRAKKIQKLRAQPKHEFRDDEYFNARSNLEDTVSDALEEGLKNASDSVTTKAATASSSTTTTDDSSDNNSKCNESNQAGGSGIKRKSTNTAKKLKKKIKGAQWLDDDLSSDSDENSSSDDDNGNDNTNNSTDATAKKSSNQVAVKQLEHTKTKIAA